MWTSIVPMYMIIISRSYHEHIMIISMMDSVINELSSNSINQQRMSLLAPPYPFHESCIRGNAITLCNELTDSHGGCYAQYRLNRLHSFIEQFSTFFRILFLYFCIFLGHFFQQNTTLQLLHNSTTTSIVHISVYEPAV